MSAAQHPLFDLLHYYVENFPQNRQTVEDLSDLAYHQQYGLAIRPSGHWDWNGVLVELVRGYLGSRTQQKQVSVVYLNVEVYKKFISAIDDDRVSYHCWQDIYLAMNDAPKNVHRLNMYKSKFAVSNLVIAMVPPDFQNIVDQIGSFCRNCLIVIEAMD